MGRNEKVILIAGGAGSIGSALAMHLGRAGCDDLILIDKDENQMEDCRQRLEERTHTRPICYIVDVRNITHLSAICSRHLPDIYINACAHKHLGIGQRNVAETTRNNILTTLNLLNVRHLSKDSKFLHVSTDKAVSPSSVMGASKMLCESAVRGAYPRTASNNRIVRFGNVKDTNGSVFRIWERQYAEGQPLTVTDLKMKRWMMSMDDACEQILRVLYLDPATYVLDMGPMYSVGDMLEMFLKSKGLSDYPTRFIGAKSGEKEEERLFWDCEKRTEINAGGRKLTKVTNSPTFDYHKALAIARTFDDTLTLRCLAKMFQGLRA